MADQVIIEFLADTAGLQVAAKQMLALGTVTKEQYAAFNKANTENEQRIKAVTKAQLDLDKAVKASTVDAKSMSDQFRNLTATIAGEVLKEAAVAIAEMGEAAEQSTAKFTSAKQELKALTTQITSGDLKGEALREATARAAELTDQIADAKGAIRALASDTRGIDLVVEGARGMAAAFSVAQGAAALLGAEDEDLQKGILKVQAAMGVLTGVQEVANILTTEGGIATKAYGFALIAVDRISKLTGLSMAASWALATAGITVVIAAIAGLIYYLNQANDNSEELAKNEEERQKSLAETIAKGKETSYKRVIELDKDFEREQNRIRQQALLDGKSADATELLLLDAKVKSIRGKLAGLNLTRAFIGKEQADQRKKDLEDLELDALVSIKEINSKTIASAKEKAAKIRDLDAKNLADTEARNLKYKQDEINADIASIQERLILLQSGSDEEVLIFKELIEAKKRLALIDPSLSREQLSLQLAQLEDEYQRHFATILASRKDADKAALNLLATNHNLQIGLQRDFGLSQQTIDDEFATSGFATFKEYEEKKRKELQTTADATKVAREQEQAAILEVKKFAIDTARQVSDAIFENEAQERATKLDEELSALEEAKNSELENENLTKAQKEAINKRYRDKEAKLKLEAWQADQAAKAQQAIINGILGFTMALATLPPPGSYIAGAISIATAAVEAGLIMSKAPPKFEKGGKNIPSGLKLVGEKGPEYIWTPGGETIIPHADTAALLDKWSIPHAPVPDKVLAMAAQTNNDKAISFDYTKMAKSFAEEMRNNPHVSVNVDSNGLVTYIHDKGSVTKVMNVKYDNV